MPIDPLKLIEGQYAGQVRRPPNEVPSLEGLAAPPDEVLSFESLAAPPDEVLSLEGLAAFEAAAILRPTPGFPQEHSFSHESEPESKIENRLSRRAGRQIGMHLQGGPWRRR